MKNSLTRTLIIAAAALSATACQQETSVDTDETKTVEVTVGLPQGISSYAGGQLPEGGFSNLGGAYNVDPAQYDLRYIMEAWTDGTPSRLAYRQTVTVDNDFINTSVKFTAHLVAMEYNFIFWADFVPQGTSEDHVYNTSSTNGLQEITISSEGRQAGNEYADAYYASKPVDLTLSGQSIGKVELTRPFGKIRLIATDAVDGQLGDRPGTATVTYGTDLTLPGTFNALTGKASGSVAAGQYTFTVYQETATVQGYEPIEDAYIIGSDYIFASDASTSYAFGVQVFSSLDQNRKIGEKQLSQIPLEKNKLTTLVGNFYSNEGDVEIIISDSFDEPEII